MKNQKFYCLKQRNGQVWRFYHHSKTGIMTHSYTSNTWSEPRTICKDGTEHFSVYLDRRDQIYLFCQKHSGDIVFYVLTGSQWIENLILRSKTGKLYPIHFETVQSRNHLHLFYNIVDTKSNHHVLIHQFMDEKGEWSTPSVMDNIYPINNLPFTLHKDWHNNGLLTYQTYKNDYHLGIRKYSLYHDKWEAFDDCDHTLFEYIDYDALLSNQFFHMIYIRNDKSENTLTYRRKGKAWEKPVIVFAHSKIDSCNIFFLKYILTIAWICEGNLYIATSTDQGKTFTKPTMKAEVETIPQKIVYQSNYSERIHAKHLYMDTDQILNGLLYSDILPPKMMNQDHSDEQDALRLKSNSLYLDDPKTKEAENAVSFNKLSDIQKNVIYENKNTAPIEDIASSPIPPINAVVQELYHSIDSSKKILHSLESSIASTDHIYKDKSSEINKLTTQLGILQNRNDALMKKNEELKQKNDELREKLVSQIKETKSLESQVLKKEHIIEYLKKEVELRKAPLIITAEDPRKRNRNSLVKRLLLGDDMENLEEE